MVIFQVRFTKSLSPRIPTSLDDLLTLDHLELIARFCHLGYHLAPATCKIGKTCYCVPNRCPEDEVKGQYRGHGGFFETCVSDKLHHETHNGTNHDQGKNVAI